jgi:hypothetical protein
MRNMKKILNIAFLMFFTFSAFANGFWEGFFEGFFGKTSG